MKSENTFLVHRSISCLTRHRVWQVAYETIDRITNIWQRPMGQVFPLYPSKANIVWKHCANQIIVQIFEFYLSFGVSFIIFFKFILSKLKLLDHSDVYQSEDNGW